MKHKYVISKSDEKDELVIREYSELDKDMFSLLCEQIYDGQVIASAIAKGQGALISTLRTENMYPIGIFAEKIAESVLDLYDAGADHPIELVFNDVEMLLKNQTARRKMEDIEDEADEIDELLDDDDTIPDFDDDDDLNDLSPSLKITDDDPFDMDDED